MPRVGYRLDLSKPDGGEFLFYRIEDFQTVINQANDAIDFVREIDAVGVVLTRSL